MKVVIYVYHINELVSYGIHGVCKIQEIIQKNFDGKTTDYYVLKPLYDTSSTVFVPVHNEKLKTKMRLVLSQEEIGTLLTDFPREEIEWSSNNHSRHEQWSEILSNASPVELMRMVHCLLHQKSFLAEQHKKLQDADERALKTAESLIDNEFALVLHMQPDEVLPYIRSKTLTA